MRIFCYPHNAIYDEIAAPRRLQLAEECLELTAAAQFNVVQLQRLQWRRPIAIAEITVLQQRTQLIDSIDDAALQLRIVAGTGYNAGRCKRAQDAEVSLGSCLVGITIRSSVASLTFTKNVS